MATFDTDVRAVLYDSNYQMIGAFGRDALAMDVTTEERGLRLKLNATDTPTIELALTNALWVKMCFSVHPIDRAQTQEIVTNSPADICALNAGSSSLYAEYKNPSGNGGRYYYALQTYTDVEYTTGACDISNGTGAVVLPSGRVNIYSTGYMTSQALYGAANRNFKCDVTIGASFNPYTPTPTSSLKVIEDVNGNNLILHYDDNGTPKRKYFSKAGSLWVPMS